MAVLSSWVLAQEGFARSATASNTFHSVGPNRPARRRLSPARRPQRPICAGKPTMEERNSKARVFLACILHLSCGLSPFTAGKPSAYRSCHVVEVGVRVAFIHKQPILFTSQRFSTPKVSLCCTKSMCGLGTRLNEQLGSGPAIVPHMYGGALLSSSHFQRSYARSNRNHRYRHMANDHARITAWHRYVQVGCEGAALRGARAAWSQYASSSNNKRLCSHGGSWAHTVQQLSTCPHRPFMENNYQHCQNALLHTWQQTQPPMTDVIIQLC